jgi:hypothetical protein
MLHMIGETMWLLFKAVEQLEQYQLIRNLEHKPEDPEYVFVMTC